MFQGTGTMHIFYRKPKWNGWGQGVKQVETPRLHIGWNKEDIQMWDAFPYRGHDGELAYTGGPVITIHENPEPPFTSVKSYLHCDLV
jgi:hypothetical protein